MGENAAEWNCYNPPIKVIIFGIMKKILFVIYFVFLSFAVIHGDVVDDRVAGLECENVLWRNVGPGGGGWMQSLCASKYDPQRFIVGSDIGGFFYSEDGGKSYEPRNKGLKHFFIETVVEHPTNENVIFIGSYGGIYKTVNRGKQWVEKRNGLPPVDSYHHSIMVSRFAFDPVNPDVMYAVLGAPRSFGKKLRNHGVLKSFDGGESWRFCAASNQLPEKVSIMDIAINPKDGNRILISTETNGVFLSKDGGVHWQPSNTGLPNMLIRRLGQSLSHPNIVYVTLRQRGGVKPWNAGIYRSDDGGETWKPRNKGLPAAVGNKGGGDRNCFWYDWVLVHPTNPDVVYAGCQTWWGAGVYKTIDGGMNWKRIFARGTADLGWINFWGPAAECFTMSLCAPETLAFGTSGIVMRTEDGGETWDQRYTENRSDGKVGSIGLEVTCLHNVQGDATRKGRFYLSYYDIGFLRTDDNGRTMQRFMKGIPGKYSNSCFGIAQDPQNPNHIWGGFGTWGGNIVGCVAESFDGGETWNAITNKASGWVEAPARHLTLVGKKPPYTLLYKAGKFGVQISHDSGKIWQSLTLDAAPWLARADIIKVFDEVIYIGTKANDEFNAEVWKSTDKGETWTNVLSEKECASDITSISVDGEKILLGIRYRWTKKRPKRVSGAFYSDDGGKTWKQVFNDRFVSATLIVGDNLFLSMADHPYHDHCIGGGVVRSRDGGKTWKTLNSDTLHSLNVTRLCVDPFDRNMLWLGTGGNSVFVGKYED